MLSFLGKAGKVVVDPGPYVEFESYRSTVHTDSAVDCDDADGTDDAACQPAATEICSDGLDNDGDGYVDCDDFGCAKNKACR